MELFEGICDGTIVKPRGNNDFGWDPIFQPLNINKTFAELPINEKNDISHRGKALIMLKKYLEN